MKSWKTTLAGVIGAIGAFLVTQPDHTVQVIGQALSAIGTFLLGLFARDNKVTSEQAGAK